MAKLYSIADLLIGKPYNSRSLSGTIAYAEKTDNVYFGENQVAYLALIREHGMFKDNYRYIAVRMED